MKKNFQNYGQFYIPCFTYSGMDFNKRVRARKRVGKRVNVRVRVRKRVKVRIIV